MFPRIVCSSTREMRHDGDRIVGSAGDLHEQVPIQRNATDRAIRWSRVNLPRRTGVCPRGAQVRTAIGNRYNPASSRPVNGGLLLLGFFSLVANLL
jgi:hypothetical protein